MNYQVLSSCFYPVFSGLLTSFLASGFYPFYPFHIPVPYVLGRKQISHISWLLLGVRIEPRLFRTVLWVILCELITAEPLNCLQPRYSKGSFRPLCFWSPCVLGLGPPPVCCPHSPCRVLVSLLRSLPACRCFCHLPFHDRTWRAWFVFMHFSPPCWTASLSVGLLGSFCWDMVDTLDYLWDWWMSFYMALSSGLNFSVSLFPLQ